MYRHLLLLILLLPIHSFGQTDDMDSLRIVIASDIPDTSLVKAYRLMAYEMMHHDPEEGILYADSSQKLAEKIGWQFGEARALYLLALAYDFATQTDNSVRTFARARKLFEDIDNQEWVGNCINSAGVSHYYAGQYNRALHKYLEALEHWKKINDKVHASQTLNNIGVIYRQQLKHAQAIEIYEKSVSLKKELGDDLGLAFTYRNLGIAHSYLGDEELAIEYCKEAVVLLENLKEYRELTGAHGSLGTSYMKLGRFDEAEQSLEHALKLAEDAVDSKELRTIYATMATVKNKLNKPDEAVLMANLTLATLNEGDDHATRRDALQEKAIGLMALGQFEDAAKAYKNTFEETLVISDSSRVKEMEGMQAQFEVKQSEQELAISELQLAEKKNQNTVFIWGLVAAALLLILAIGSVRGKVRNNRRLKEKNGIIQKSLSEKEVLLREIHHRVKNNLQVISSLLSLQSREIEDPAALQAVNESRNRVKSMSLIHQNLYQEDNLTGIDVGDYVEKLSRSLFASYRVDQDAIILKTDIDHLNLDVDTAIPIGLILNELITNALKHAFIGREEGTLEVRLKEKDNVLELTIADDGIGMSAPKESKGDSFGMKMIDTFSQKLDAEFKVEEDNGTTVKIRIRKYKKAS